MYNHNKQYRCAIIRGKSQRELDNLLPAYATIVDQICPCTKETFENKFNVAFTSLIHGKSSSAAALKKTLDNHRTEIAGKLFGMYYVSSDGMVYVSERTRKFLEDNDQPAFFKDMCYKMQFPNGMNKIQILQEHLDLGITLRQYPFIIKCLMLADEAKVKLSADDIGYYILNALDVLQGKALPSEVMDQIIADKSNGIQRKIVCADKASSYTMQHIREQLNYLELANLIYVKDRHIYLNKKESVCLNAFASCCMQQPMFDIYSCDTSTQAGRDELYRAWGLYYSQISNISQQFVTNVDALIAKDDHTLDNIHTTNETNVELGDEGEQFVYEYEKKRVGAFNRRLVSKVIPLGKTRGLGYDIQSVIAEDGEFSEFVKYIEVKSTKRVTAPDINDDTWMDTVNITRNEWIAAQQHKELYSIYRVYFVRNGVVVFIVKDIFEKYKNGILQVVPTVYRVEFSNSAVDERLE